MDKKKKFESQSLIEVVSKSQIVKTCWKSHIAPNSGRNENPKSQNLEG